MLCHDDPSGLRWSSSAGRTCVNGVATLTAYAIIPALILACLLPVGGSAQILADASLNGKYYFVHLLALVSEATGEASAQNLGGGITFDGNGGYTFDGELGTGSGAPESVTGNGTYSVDENAFVTLTNPITNTLEINGRLGVNNEVLLGASTEARDGSYDLFVAIRSPASGVGNGILAGAYTGATLMFPDGAEAGIKTALLYLTAGGDGSFNPASATGHSADGQDTNVQQPITSATYSLTGDGSGTAAFGSSATLFSGNRRIFSSVDGNYVIGYSTDPGGREIFLAIRNFSTSADDLSWQDKFWIAEIVVDIDLIPGVNLYTSASGGLRSTGTGQAAISQRVNFDLFQIDFSGVNSYAINADSTGFLGGLFDPGSVNMAIGAPSNTVSPAAIAALGSQPPASAQNGPRPQAFVGARVGALGDFSPSHGIFFGVREPTITANGVFVSPLGVLNAASFAPTTYPLSGGTLVALFGSGLAPSKLQAPDIPIPTVLNGVSVTIDGVPAPLLFVSDIQINLQVPFATGGSTASVVVNNNGQLSNAVAVPVGVSSPGIFSTQSNGLGPGTITHVDGSKITADDPAEIGETVVVFLTGLGPLNPPFADGHAPPDVEPLARTTDPNIAVAFGGFDGLISYSGGSPCCVGLYQVNVRVPNGVIPDPAVPVTVFTSTAISDFVELAIVAAPFSQSAESTVSPNAQTPLSRHVHRSRVR